MTVQCPTCQTDCDWEGNAFRPFCSEQCRKRDLGNWATERYRVPGEESGESLEEDSEDKKVND